MTAVSAEPPVIQLSAAGYTYAGAAARSRR